MQERNPFGGRYPERRLRSPSATSWAELFLVDIVDTLQLSAGPAPACAKPLFGTLIRHYLLSEVPVCPTKPIGWAHKPRQCSDGCYSCRELDNFLTSETEKTHRFKMNLADRKYAEEKLPTGHFDYITLKTKPPHVLVVTKRGEEHQDHLMWFNKCLEELEKKLLPLRTPRVQEMLGDELYAELVLLEKIRPGPGGEPPRALMEANVTTAGQALTEGNGNNQTADDVIEQPMTSKMRVGGVVDSTEED